jgi:hypothetical protein
LPDCFGNKIITRDGILRDRLSLRVLDVTLIAPFSLDTISNSILNISSEMSDIDSNLILDSNINNKGIESIVSDGAIISDIDNNDITNNIKKNDLLNIKTLEFGHMYLMNYISDKIVLKKF